MKSKSAFPVLAGRFALVLCAFLASTANAQRHMFSPLEEVVSAALKSETGNLLNLMEGWSGLADNKVVAMSALREALGDPVSANMVLSAPSDSTEKIQADMETYRKVAEASIRHGNIKERIDAYERLRLQNLVFRKQLEAISAKGRPPLGVIERLKIATDLRALSIDQLNATSLSLATESALAEQARAKRAEVSAEATKARRRELQDEIISKELGEKVSNW
jgi:hypothetical protein